MSKQVKQVRLNKNWVAFTLLLGAGYLIGATRHDPIVRAADRREKDEPQHFQSGAQRSEVLLREISATLGKMDARLERMEKLATRFVNTNSGQPPRENVSR